MTRSQPLIVQSFDSGFALAHDSYNCISAAPDGRIYYVLASAQPDQGGRVFRFDPASTRIDPIAELDDCCGEKNSGCIAQGKSHDGFYAFEGRFFFSTHVGYYESIDGMERLPVHHPTGGGLYPGGHLLSIDPANDRIQDHVTLPGEGIIAMTLDADRGIAYLLSWPGGVLYAYHIRSGRLVTAGKVAGAGEAGEAGKDYRVLCRSLLADPRSGIVYGSTAEGNIFSYHPGHNLLSFTGNQPLKRDYFGQYAIADPGSMAYHWRKILWNSRQHCAYGVHGNSGYLFRFEPENGRMELLQRISSAPSLASGMYDQFSYGYLGLALDEQAQVLYYLCGGPIAGEQHQGIALAKGGARGPENLHLVTYSLLQHTYRDHGPLFYSNGERPTYVNSIALGKDGYIYSLARLERRGSTITDLIRIPAPTHY